MIIVMSSAYVSDEFQAEIGKIPPALLPLGNRKLIEHQVAVLRDNYPHEEIILSLPESFKLSETLKKQLLTLRITIRSVPDQFTLSEALLYILNTSGELLSSTENIKILFGDTYITDLSFSDDAIDLIALSEAKTSYAWEYMDDEDYKNLIWCGFFKFSNIPSLLKSLALERKSFNDAIKLYAQHNAMQYVQTYDWHDLGHINTYFSARAHLTTQRAFNELRIDGGTVRKSGEPQIKIQAEANWFQTIPPAIKKFTPLFVDSYKDNDKFCYELEYLSSMPLNELFVHGYNKAQDWKIVFSEVEKFFQAGELQQNEKNSDSLEAEFLLLLNNKTYQRLSLFSEKSGKKLDTPMYYEGEKLPSILDICKECILEVEKLPIKPSVLHGDLCFSNMIFDARSLRLKVIDPRGLDSQNQLTIYGDAKYDLAKLTHSVIGLYDFIISGNYKILNAGTENESLIFDIEQRVEDIQALFYEMSFLEDISIKQIIPLVIILFFSMLPLHDDRPDRQEAMLLNALRLYCLHN